MSGEIIERFAPGEGVEEEDEAAYCTGREAFPVARRREEGPRMGKGGETTPDAMAAEGEGSVAAAERALIERFGEEKVAFLRERGRKKMENMSNKPDNGETRHERENGFGGGFNVDLETKFRMDGTPSSPGDDNEEDTEKLTVLEAIAMSRHSSPAVRAASLSLLRNLLLSLDPSALRSVSHPDILEPMADVLCAGLADTHQSPASAAMGAILGVLEMRMYKDVSPLLYAEEAGLGDVFPMRRMQRSTREEDGRSVWAASAGDLAELLLLPRRGLLATLEAVSDYRGALKVALALVKRGARGADLVASHGMGLLGRFFSLTPTVRRGIQGELLTLIGRLVSASQTAAAAVHSRGWTCIALEPLAAPLLLQGAREGGAGASDEELTAALRLWRNVAAQGLQLACSFDDVAGAVCEAMTSHDDNSENTLLLAKEGFLLITTLVETATGAPQISWPLAVRATNWAMDKIITITAPPLLHPPDAMRTEVVAAALRCIVSVYAASLQSEFSALGAQKILEDAALIKIVSSSNDKQLKPPTTLEGTWVGLLLPSTTTMATTMTAEATTSSDFRMYNATRGALRELMQLTTLSLDASRRCVEEESCTPPSPPPKPRKGERDYNLLHDLARTIAITLSQVCLEESGRQLSTLRRIENDFRHGAQQTRLALVDLMRSCLNALLILLDLADAGREDGKNFSEEVKEEEDLFTVRVHALDLALVLPALNPPGGDGSVPLLCQLALSREDILKLIYGVARERFFEGWRDASSVEKKNSASWHCAQIDKGANGMSVPEGADFVASARMFFDIVFGGRSEIDVVPITLVGKCGLVREIEGSSGPLTGQWLFDSLQVVRKKVDGKDAVTIHTMHYCMLMGLAELQSKYVLGIGHVSLMKHVIMGYAQSDFLLYDDNARRLHSILSDFVHQHIRSRGETLPMDTTELDLLASEVGASSCGDVPMCWHATILFQNTPSSLLSVDLLASFLRSLGSHDALQLLLSATECPAALFSPRQQASGGENDVDVLLDASLEIAFRATPALRRCLLSEECPLPIALVTEVIGSKLFQENFTSEVGLLKRNNLLRRVLYQATSTSQSSDAKQFLVHILRTYSADLETKRSCVKLAIHGTELMGQLDSIFGLIEG